MSVHPLAKLHGYWKACLIHIPSSMTSHDQVIHCRLINAKSWWSDQFSSIICHAHLIHHASLTHHHVSKTPRSHTLRPCWGVSEKASVLCEVDVCTTARLTSLWMALDGLLASRILWPKIQWHPWRQENGWNLQRRPSSVWRDRFMITYMHAKEIIIGRCLTHGTVCLFAS